MTRAQRARAGRRLAVGLGAVRSGRAPTTRSRPTGCPPARRCPACPTLRALWKPALTPVLAAVDELVVDLRSGSYAALAPVPGRGDRGGAQRAPGRHPRRWSATSTRRTRAGVARLLATTTAEPDDVVRLRGLLRRAGLHVEHDGGAALTLVVPAP